MFHKAWGRIKSQNILNCFVKIKFKISDNYIQINNSNVS